MTLLDDLRQRREERAAAIDREAAEARANERARLAQLRAQKLANAARTINSNVKWFFGLVTAIVCGWSLSALGRALGMPTWVGILAAITIDGAWLYCLMQVHLNRETPYRALGAHTTSQLLLVASIALNFAHGLLTFGVTWLGFGAGVLFALFPILLKVIIHFSTENPLSALLKVPGGRSLIREMGNERARMALAALADRDRIDRYRLAQNAEIELARADLMSNHELEMLSAQFRTELEAASGLSAGQSGRTADTEADTSGQSGHYVLGQQSATAPTGPDVVRTPAPVLPSDSPDKRPQIEIIRELLTNGTPRERVVNEVLKVKPDAQEDSVRRALSRELRTGNYM